MRRVGRWASEAIFAELDLRTTTSRFVDESVLTCSALTSGAYRSKQGQDTTRTLEDVEYMLPDTWMRTERWEIVAEFLRWLPVPWADRKQSLLLWAGRAGVTLTRYHYESIARPGEVGTDAGTD